jgi:hypothetical protein
MKYFPITWHSNLGGNKPSRRFDEWQTELDFNNSKSYRREHVPEYTRIVKAILTINGERGTYLIDFPRKEKLIKLRKSPRIINVKDYVAIGRHTYKVIPLGNQKFSARLSILVTRPTVITENGSYIITGKTLKYSQRNWLEDDRAAHRIGRFDLYLKTIHQNYEDTNIISAISLNGKWKYKKIYENDIYDYSKPNLDDSEWDEIEVPHTWEESIPNWNGLVWYRKKVIIPVEWKGQKTILRFSGIDDEPHIYINGHEVGYSCGWHRPFQIDISDYVDYGKENVIAILVKRRRPEKLGYDGGITYNFVKDWAIVKYPVKNRFLGGIFGEKNEIAIVKHTGSVIFEPRIHPKFEGNLRITFHYMRDGKIFPLSMLENSEFIYKPPYMHYRKLYAGERSRADLKSIVSYDRNLIYFEGRINEQDGYIVTKIEAFPFKFEGDINISNLGEVVEVSEKQGCFRVWFSLLTRTKDSEVEVRMDQKHVDYTDYRRRDIVIVKSKLDETGKFKFVLSAGENVEEDFSWIKTVKNPFESMVEQWEECVYSFTVPKKMSENFKASLRVYKQTLTLCSRLIKGEVSGLITDPIKYPIFWLRDAAISIPGAIYAGRLAWQAAISTAGEVFARARKDAECPILRPDGSIMPGQVNSDSSLLAVFAIYKVWCQMGNEWLKKYYETVKTYLNYGISKDMELGDALDGIIRSSEGDWFDFAFKNEYEREGASLWVNIIYLRALKYGSQMALAIGDLENAKIWNDLYEKGCSMITRRIEDGGLFMENFGYLADTIQTISNSHPNAWKYPDDLDKVYVFPGFRSISHCIAIREGIIKDPILIQNIVKKIDEYNVIRPFPALVQYPWNDYMRMEGVQGEYEETEFKERWKCLPGCHAAGGRWAFAGGIVQLGLWSANAIELAREAKENQAGYLTLAKQPARVFEDAHFSGLFRNEAGDPKDTEGFYYNWGAATPLEALVEGEYGIEPIPGGVRISPRNCEVNDGIYNIAIWGGKISYERCEERKYVIKLDAEKDGSLIFISPFEISEDKINIHVECGLRRFRLTNFTLKDKEILIKYEKDWKKISINL